MTKDSPFKSLFDRVRNGDADAALELVETYEAELRIVVRSRLRDSQMRRALDSMDLCQSVFCNFFVRTAGGQFDLDNPEELMRLLTTMARNKLTDRARYELAEKRDARLLAPAPADDYPISGRDPTPSQAMAARELLDQLHASLPKETLEIADLRREGMGWDELGRRYGQSPDAIRKRYMRSVDRVCQDLGLDNVD